ncbi:DUF2142 domain-containing protein [Curtobacterium sp. 9128]|uniref:DUF2142 domain-containing protein n=1 Tax=Curtobacterium sp. 9128 TaxID=1793722 RepID=UPI001642A75D|nr:DUF2142 domain-containing protein [Curtobacterium sp. 9128]
MRATPTSRASVTVPSVPPVRRIEVVAVGVTTVAFLLLLTAYALLTPMFQAPDEPAHVDAVVQLALGHGWADPGTLRYLNATLAVWGAPGGGSTNPSWAALLAAHPGTGDQVNQMTQHPPTYYALAAALLDAVHFQHLRWDHAVLLLRFLDVAFSAALPVFAWATTRRLTASPIAGVVAAVVVLGIPELPSIGASVTNDAPVLLLGAAVVLLVTRVLTGDDRVRTVVALGLLTGLLIVVKGTGLPAVPIVGAAVLLAGLRSQTRVVAVIRAVGVLAVAGVVGGWWWVRNLLVFHTLQPDGFTSYQPHKPFPAGTGPDLGVFLNVSWGTITRTFWGSPGQRAQFAIAPLTSAVVSIVLLVVLVGWAFRRDGRLVPAIVLTALPVLVFAAQTWTVWRTYVDSTVVGGTQGRYYYSTLVGLIALSALAWSRLATTGPVRRALAATIVVLAVLVAVVGLWFVVGVFWQNGSFRPTGAGLDAFRAAAPLPVRVVAVVVGALALALAATAVVAVTAVLKRRPVPGDALPLDSPTTVEPTVRNQTP